MWSAPTTPRTASVRLPPPQRTESISKSNGTWTLRTDRQNAAEESVAEDAFRHAVEFGPWRHYNAVATDTRRFLPKIITSTTNLSPLKSTSSGTPRLTLASHKPANLVPFSLDSDYHPLHPAVQTPAKRDTARKVECVGCSMLSDEGPSGKEFCRWLEEQKRHLLDQYLRFCAIEERPTLFRTSLQYFLNEPEVQRLDLSQAKAMSRDIYVLLCALVGKGGKSKDKATTIHAISNHLANANLTSLNVSNNRLGVDGIDKFLTVLLEAEFLQSCPCASGCRPQSPDAALTELDISQNCIPVEGATAIRDMLLSNYCTIQKLHAGRNNLQDLGCAAIAEALCENISLISLDLSENNASKHTGTALGKMLQVNSTLRTLHLHYNHIRHIGARSLCAGLAKNKTLTELKLQWNGFGDEVTTDQLGRALPKCGLTSLSLAHNRIDARGAAILSEAIEIATQLVQINLDGNPMGVAGARAIVRAGAQHTRAGAAGEFGGGGGDGDGDGGDGGGGAGGAEISVVSSPVYGFCGTLKGRIGVLRTATQGNSDASFDPAEPSGDYELDLREPFPKSVLFKLIQLQLSGKGTFAPLRTAAGGLSACNGTLQLSASRADAVTVRVSDGGSVDRAEWYISVEDLRCRRAKLHLVDEEDKAGGGGRVPAHKRWASQLGRAAASMACVLRLTFQDTRRSATAQDSMTPEAFDRLHAALGRALPDYDKCMELFENSLGAGVFVSFAQATKLFELMRDPGHGKGTGNKEDVSRLRVFFVTNCFHKIVEVGRNKDLLDLLVGHEKATAERMLGMVSLEFTPNNPTGFHRLDMGNASEREVFFRLVEFKNDMDVRVRQFRDFYKTNRFGGKREDESNDLDLHRVWRNAKLDGKHLDENAKVPRAGIFQVDFVMITMPNVQEGQDYPSICDYDFEELLKMLLDGSRQEMDKIAHVRKLSNDVLFTCRQLAAILAAFSEPQFRVEACVIGYSRLIDWHGYRNVIVALNPFEYRLLERRLGAVNLFNDTMAVGRYELDLARPAHRFVMQELVHLASVEPGHNLVACTYKDIDFDVPQGWLSDVARSGVIVFYYCREQAVIERVFETGSWDSAGSPYHVREDGKPYSRTSWSTYVPHWLQEFCKQDPKGGPVPCSQPAGEAWVMALKIRYIKLRMMEKFRDPRKLFNAMDADGGGSLSRREIASGLYQLGLWLHPKELATLLDFLDRDGGGDVDFDEFKLFWDTCNLD